VSEIAIRRIDAPVAHELRHRVLRAGAADPQVDLPVDHEPGAWHLGAFLDERLVGVVSFYPIPTSHRPLRVTQQFRMMAVEPDVQGGGVGRALLGTALEDLRGRGVETVWANARDSALGFYERMGFHAVGESWIHEETGLPHTVVLMDLTANA